ncbi:MAG: hypothetical protein CO183_02700 [Candidatus Zambryskibacteria bacterium CG_4_9_14_3_um_filter_42_9]|uniref:Uncharacterized protein n=1 Tax=Candidatus Zambryskibacteria bacterium CG22_combo_CG10-13_8_21_14_all_42_17 TaxID=1975118 RepID=A0A2H0BFL8_9BACT|nr:MAG: hypothetical protein COX06_01230 [Candidatus Zambryskibacteria bacterium CG22_combo_CG10-13_8_21_14_all_42_17]PJA36599.1 MAG: hypothetical protein CO183_02700 [Candidatus Zambryskibacteria bacterium CG_4_9_14_3_um_filter_42_9]
MPKNRIIVVLGVLVALQPFLGFPRVWEMFFQVIVGMLIVILSVWASIDKYLTLKAKAQRRQVYRHKEIEIQEEASEVQANNQDRQ